MSQKRIKFTKGRHVVGHGAYEPGDEISFADALASQLVHQEVAEYVEIARPRKMVEKKAEVKTAEMKLSKFRRENYDDEDDIDATD